MLWGAYGANVVHMSVLQEYMAFAIGVEVGVYRQVSDSFHVYLNPVWDKVKDLTIDPHSFRQLKNPYDSLKNYTPTPLFTDIGIVEDELKTFFGIAPEGFTGATENSWINPVFKDIAVPMMAVYACYKSKDFHRAYEMLYTIRALDWRGACFSWLQKREQSYINKTKEGEAHE
tara:strand:- start:3252 stop:3770 length:519 start_codon:yes stop_codon:yes gene_type:complete